MPYERTLATASAAGIVTIALIVGGAAAALPSMAGSLPGAVTAGLVAVLVLAVVITGVTGAGTTRRTPYW
jgi:hypothetical protein